ncbi:MAG: magnesium chelatase subunit D [Pseudomonadota bacterium]
MTAEAPLPQGVSSAERWQAACLAARLFALDPLALGGIALHARPGPLRDRWLGYLASLLPETLPQRRLPLGVTDDRLLGGLDLAATLKAQRRVLQPGILAEVNGGLLTLAMAERLSSGTVGRILAVLDSGRLRIERDGVSAERESRFALLALDESHEEEAGPPPALLDRFAFLLDLEGLSLRDAPLPEAERVVARAPVEASPEATAALCEAAAGLGIASLRTPLLALRCASLHAALKGREQLQQEDLAVAGQLVLAPRARQVPGSEEAEAEPGDPNPGEPETADEQQQSAEPDPQTESGLEDLSPEQLRDLVVESAAALLPPDLLASLQLQKASRGGPQSSGQSGSLQRSKHRGRRIGATRGRPEGGARLAVLDTLRAAAPLQRLRRDARAAGKADRVLIEPEDFRIARFKQRSETVTLFLVDASGSSALARLAEAKGAIELLLADAYSRRDQVAVIAFRGLEAEVVLPPTRSLVRAKRCLAGLHGGGGTPLAAALESAQELLEGIRRKGQTPILVLLTDGAANVARDGTPGRAQARADALAAAQMLAASGVAALLVDTAPRPKPAGRDLAAALRARYLPLPYADPAKLSRAVREEVSP